MKINKFLYGVLAICGCVVSVYLFRELLAFFSPDDLGTTLMAVSGAAATAGETMRGTVTTTKPAKADGTVDDQDINRPTISKKITKINPSLFPMDTLLRELENVPVQFVRISVLQRPGPRRAKQSKNSLHRDRWKRERGKANQRNQRAHLFAGRQCLVPHDERGRHHKGRHAGSLGWVLAQSADLPHRRYRFYCTGQNHDLPDQRSSTPRAAR